MKFTRHSRLSANASPDLQIDREFSSAVQLSCRVVSGNQPLRFHFPCSEIIRLAVARSFSRRWKPWNNVTECRWDSIPSFRPSPPKSKGSGGISERRILAFRHSPPPFGPPLTSLPALLGSISCHREMRFWMDARSSLRFLLCSMFFFLFFLLDKFQSDELVRCSLAFGICF